MASELLRQLEGGLSEIIDLWVDYWDDFPVAPSLAITRSEVRNVVMLLIDAMEEVESGALSTPDDLQNSIIINEITNLFLRLEKSGVRSERKRMSSLLCIKGLRVGIERYLPSCVATEEKKQELLSRLRRITDVIETSVLLGEADSQGDGTEYSSQKEQTTYKNIFETTSNLVLITDEEGFVVEVNPTVRVMFTGQRVINRFCGELLQTQGDLRAILKRYPPETSNEISIEQDGITKTFNLQIRLLSKSYPLAKGLLFILNDITCAVDHRQLLEKRVVERTRALTKSEKLLDSIFQSMGQGILLLDQELEIVQANRMASEMFGVPLEVLIGNGYQEITDAEGVRKLQESSRSLKEGEIRDIEITGLYVDGDSFPCRVTVTVMHLEGQEMHPLIVRDISREKEMEASIVEQKRQAEEMNVTLRNVLKSIEEEKKEFEEGLSTRIRSSLLPAIARIRKERDRESRDGYLLLLEQQMLALTRDFATTLDGDLLKLSKTELRICHFIKAGLTGKEICDTMNLSFETIQTHRKNIRKKLDLRGRNVNLHSFLADRVL